MGKFKFLTAVIAGALFLGLVGQAQAARDGVSGSKQFRAECRTLTSTVPITRDQAQSHLPPGFESSVGSADQNEVPYVYISSTVCGDEAEPTLTMATAYLYTKPPQRYEMGGSSAGFILAAAIGGTDADRFERIACLEDVFVDDAQISQTEHAGSVDYLAAGSTVTSDVLSVSLEQATATLFTDTAMSSDRWFYETDDGVGFVDFLEARDLVGLGSGAVRFDQPFLDLPPAAAGPSLWEEGHLIVPARKCS